MTLIPKFANAHPHPSRPTLGALLGIPTSVAGSEAGDAFAAAAAEARRFPLQKVVARATVVGDCATTELSEHYHNPHDLPLDVTHTIPLPASGAVIGFEIRAGGRVSRGVCKPNEQAKADFESARTRGKSAALVTQVREDEHCISLANVPPRTDVVVTLRIVERLRVDDGRFEYRLPTTIAERHVPKKRKPKLDDSFFLYDPADDLIENPPVLLAGRIPLDLEVRIAAGVTQVLPSIALDRTDEADGTVVLRPAERQSCDGDVVIRYWGRGERTQLRAYTDGERTLVIADPPADRVPELERVREAIFVLDRSGSMEGAPIASAKAAIVAALGMLKPTDRVQIIAFDHVIDSFPPKPEAATPEVLRDTLAWLEQVDARGSTTAMPALQAACRKPRHPGHVRTVLFVTDGHVANDEEIVRFTNSLDPAIRISVVGIGFASRHAMLKRLARLGGGSYASIGNEDDIGHETAAISATMLGPIACGLHEASGAESTSSDLFAGRAATIFVEGKHETVRVTSIDGAFELSCDVMPSPMPLGSLWARDQVERLEDMRIAKPRDAKSIDARIEELGVKHQLQTRMTSFVAVDEQSQVHGEALVIEQPVEVDRDAQASMRQRVAMRSSSINPALVLGKRAEVGNIVTPRSPRLYSSPVRRSKLEAFLGEDDSNNGSSFDIADTRDQSAEDAGIGDAAATLDRNIQLLRMLSDMSLSSLQGMLAPLERCEQFLSNGLAPRHDHVWAAALLLVLEACQPSRCKKPEIPETVRHVDISRGGPLWTQCMERLQPVASKPGWKGFVGAAKRGAFTEMCRRARALEGRG